MLPKYWILVDKRPIIASNARNLPFSGKSVWVDIGMFVRLRAAFWFPKASEVDY